MSDTRILDTGTDELKCEVRERVAIITFNRPHAKNSLSDDMTPALRRMVLETGKDESIGALLITGEGDAFCSGGNIKDMSSGSTPAKTLTMEERIDSLKEKQRTLTGRIAACPKPVIAALPGAAAGAGMSIALACDIRIAAERAFLTTAYANIGLSGDYGMTWALTRLVGTGRARDLMFSARRIPSDEALSLGLFNRVVPNDDLQGAALAYASKLANGPTAAFVAMKDNLDFAADHTLLESLDREAENMVRTGASEDHRRAIKAFMEARKR
jgi:enoyl-CoA hydratase/carnithine racemase